MLLISDVWQSGSVSYIYKHINILSHILSTIVYYRILNTVPVLYNRTLFIHSVYKSVAVHRVAKSHTQLSD